MKWYGIKPDLRHLRVFGCAAYAMVPKSQRRKLDPKAKKLLMVGYSPQHKDGYRLYDPETRQIVIRRDVVFNEAEKGSTGLFNGARGGKVVEEMDLPSLSFQ